MSPLWHFLGGVVGGMVLFGVADLVTRRFCRHKGDRP